MAGDWIKMRCDLQTHPKIVRILSATNSDKFRVIGGLHAVWSVFDAHSSDGVLNGYTTDLMDHVIGWNGFSKAMQDVGWLVQSDAQTLAMPDFNEHNGQSAKRRAEDQKRKRNDRKNSEKNTDNQQTTCGQKADKKRTRDREDINTPIVPLEGTNPEVSEPDLELGIDVQPSHPNSEKKENGGGGEMLRRARGLFRMREGTPLDVSQERAWRKARAVVEATAPEDWAALEWFYGLSSGDAAAKYRRRDLAQLLNHWNGEIEKAHEAAAARGETPRAAVAGPEGQCGPRGPEGWREYLREMYEAEVAEFGDLPESMREELRMAKRDGKF